MRKLLLSLAAAGAALAAASPAAAQYYPAPQPQGYAYGFNNYGQVRALQARVDAIQYQIRMLDRRNVIRDGSASRLKEESRHIEKRLRQASRHGLNPYELNDIQQRIARLEQRVQYAMNGRFGRHAQYGSYGQNGHYDRHDRNDDDRWDRDDDRGGHHGWSERDDD